ncbi:MAG: glycosyltransferase [Thaumarchaeota archaeon]|nr:glycosyltransferase [Nitrososphaerota archaeon]
MRNIPLDELVSILIPVYNREEFVKQAIESALAQTYPQIEVIAVDNCSTDTTFEVLQEYARLDSRVRCVSNEKNLGATRNWRRCFELSHGEYIKLVFSDDWLSPTALEHMVPALRSHPEAGLCYSAVSYHNEGVEGFPLIHIANSLRRDQNVGRYRFLRGLMDGSISVPHSPGQALFRRKEFDRWLITDDHNRLGISCGQFGMGNDVMLYLRACGDYPSVYHIAESLSHYRIHPSSITISSRDNSGELCILSAVAHFLSENRLTIAEKRRLMGLLWVRLFFANLHIYKNPGQWRTFVEHYFRLFPNDASAHGANLLTFDALYCLAHSIKGMVHNRIDKISRRFPKLLPQHRHKNIHVI